MVYNLQRPPSTKKTNNMCAESEAWRLNLYLLMVQCRESNATKNSLCTHDWGWWKSNLSKYVTNWVCILNFGLPHYLIKKMYIYISIHIIYKGVEASATRQESTHAVYVPVWFRQFPSESCFDLAFRNTQWCLLNISQMVMMSGWWFNSCEK